MHVMQELPAQHNAVVFVYRGEVKVGGQVVGDKRMAILKNEGDGVVIEASADAKALLIAGKPLNEPIAQYGPFVMNTEQEIRSPARSLSRKAKHLVDRNGAVAEADHIKLRLRPQIQESGPQPVPR